MTTRSKTVIFISSDASYDIIDSVTTPELKKAIFSWIPFPFQAADQPVVHITDIVSYFKNGSVLPPEEPQVKLRDQLTDTTLLTSSFFYSFLSKHDYHPIIINDFSKERILFEESIQKEVLCIAISTTFLPYKDPVLKMAKAIKQLLPEVPLVVGGPLVYLSHALIHDKRNYDPALLKSLFFFNEKDPFIDYYVIERRGEKTFLSLLNCLSQKRQPDQVPNLGLFHNNKLIFTPIQPEISLIEDEIISWDTLPEYLIKPKVAVRGSCGCTFKCGFCNFRFFASRPLVKNIEMITDELYLLNKKNNIEEVIFTDDNFFISPRQVHDVSWAMVNSNFKFSWTSFIRTTAITPENVQVLADSGVSRLILGVESGDDNILRKMKKGQTRDQILTAISLLNHNEISTQSTLVIGYPGETEDSVDQTIQMLNQYSNAGTAMNWVTPFVFMRLPFMNLDMGGAYPRSSLEGFWLDWKHDTMDVYSALEQIQRIVINTNDICIQLSPEYYYMEKVLGISDKQAKSIMMSLMKLGRLRLARKYKQGSVTPETIVNLEHELQRLLLKISG